MYTMVKDVVTSVKKYDVNNFSHQGETIKPVICICIHVWGGTRATIEMLRYTYFGLNRFLNHGAP